jgi:hypothetical protein
MPDVVGHETVTPALEDAQPAARDVLNDLGIAFVFDSLVFVTRLEWRFAPAQAEPHVDHPRRIVVEQVLFFVVPREPFRLPALDRLRPNVELAPNEVVHGFELVRCPHALTCIHAVFLSKRCFPHAWQDSKRT